MRFRSPFFANQLKKEKKNNQLNVELDHQQYLCSLGEPGVPTIVQQVCSNVHVRHQLSQADKSTCDRQWRRDPYMSVGLCW